MHVLCVDEEYLHFYPGSGQDDKDVIGPCGKSATVFDIVSAGLCNFDYRRNPDGN